MTDRRKLVETIGLALLLAIPVGCGSGGDSGDGGNTARHRANHG